MFVLVCKYFSLPKNVPLFIYKYVFDISSFCTGDGGGPLLCPGPDALDIRGLDTKEKESYYQAS